MRRILTFVVVPGLVLGATACGEAAEGGVDTVAGAPHVVVTTNILGDVVSSAFGDLVDVEVIMPAGADPHEFAASAKQATAMEDADLLVLNGAGFEAGLTGVIESVTGGGTPVFTFADHVELLSGDSHDAAHADEDHGPHDPHLWTDPTRIATAVSMLAARVGALPGVDISTANERAADYVASLNELDGEIVDLLAPVSTVDRVLVTNHQAFGYFADRYDFTIAGAVVPSLTTNSESSAKELEALADLLRAQSVRVIFAETSQSTQLAEALAAEVDGDVEIVELHTESLGAAGSGADTYLGMMRTNAELIAGQFVAG